MIFFWQVDIMTWQVKQSIYTPMQWQTPSISKDVFVFQTYPLLGHCPANNFAPTHCKKRSKIYTNLNSLVQTVYIVSFSSLRLHEYKCQILGIKEINQTYENKEKWKMHGFDILYRVNTQGICVMLSL